MLKQLFFISVVLLFTTGLQAQENTSLAVAENKTSDKTGIDRSELAEFAKTYIGIAYKYGSLDPTKGFDCSGFLYYVFNHFNIKLPRTSRQYDQLGAAQNPEEFEVGDVLIFYGYQDSIQIGHVGIICEANGMKSKFIHSSSGKANGITISQLDSGQYARRFYKCIDVIPNKNG